MQIIKKNKNLLITLPRQGEEQLILMPADEPAVRARAETGSLSRLLVCPIPTRDLNRIPHIPAGSSHLCSAASVILSLVNNWQSGAAPRGGSEGNAVLESWEFAREVTAASGSA